MAKFGIVVGYSILIIRILGIRRLVLRIEEALIDCTPLHVPDYGVCMYGIPPYRLLVGRTIRVPFILSFEGDRCQSLKISCVVGIFVDDSKLHPFWYAGFFRSLTLLPVQSGPGMDRTWCIGPWLRRGRRHFWCSCCCSCCCCCFPSYTHLRSKRCLVRTVVPSGLTRMWYKRRSVRWECILLLSINWCIPFHKLEILHMLASVGTIL